MISGVATGMPDRDKLPDIHKYRQKTCPSRDVDILLSFNMSENVFQGPFPLVCSAIGAADRLQRSIFQGPGDISQRFRYCSGGSG